MSRSSSDKGVRVLLNLALVVMTLCINLVFYSLVIYGVRYAANYSYEFAYRIFGDVSVDPPGQGRDVKVTVLRGESSMNIAAKLEDAQVIDDRYSFYVKLKLKEYEIMPGTFVLNTSMSYDEVLEKITNYSESIDTEQSVEDVEQTP